MTDNEIIQNYRRFRANGVNDLLSDDEKQEINKLEEKIKELESKISELQKRKEELLITPTKTFNTIKGETFTRDLLAIDKDYSLSLLEKIFNHGKSNYKIWFLNKANKLCVVDSCKIGFNDKLVLEITIDVNGYATPTRISLDKFLYLVQIGDFKVTNKEFAKYYLKPYIESDFVKVESDKLDMQIEDIENELKALKKSDFYKKYNTLYNQTKKEINKSYAFNIKDETRDFAQSTAKEDNKKEHLDYKMTEIKNIWNSTISDKEKAYLLGWICKHIYSIRIKVVQNGVSDKVLSKAYPDNIYGSKYREKANSSGWDASSGIITFDTTQNCPVDLIKKLSTIKHIQHTKDDSETIFKGNSISNLDLVLFLLTEYNKYGFKSGISKLNQNIDQNTLKEEKFKNYIHEFDEGYNA